MQTEKKWRPGDVVRLKSGGPKMTVERYDESVRYCVSGALCVWFAQSYLAGGDPLPQRDCFTDDDLELVEKEED